MLKGLGDLGNIMKLQKEMKSIQKKLKKTTMEGESNDGSVKAIVNGEFQLIDITIDPALLKEADSKKVEKMILSAVKNASEKIKETNAAEMSKIAGGLNIPGL